MFPPLIIPLNLASSEPGGRDNQKDFWILIIHNVQVIMNRK